MVAIGMILALLSSCFAYEESPGVEEQIERAAYLSEDDIDAIYDHRYIHGEESLSGQERSLIGLDDPTPSPRPTLSEARADEFMRCLGI